MRALQTSQVRWPSYVGHGRSPDFSMFSPICPGRKWIDGQFTQGMLVKKNSEPLPGIRNLYGWSILVSHYYPLLITIIHYILPLYYYPLLISINHYQSLLIMISHY